MAECQVDVAVLEAGLGGRFDATSVVEAEVTVLTNVGLEHTRWLGPTLTDIAEEKLAVLRRGATLVIGDGLVTPALAVAERVAREQDARIVAAPSSDGVGMLRARGAFQRRNFALARAAAEAYLELAGIVPQERAMLAAAAATDVPGRLQPVDQDPLTILDGAHNPDAVAALAESLPELVGGAPLALVMGVLDDKDAASMLATLLPLCARPGSPRRRALARCHPRRCSRGPTSSASRRPSASRSRCAHWRRREAGRRSGGSGAGHGIGVPRRGPDGPAGRRTGRFDGADHGGSAR